MKKQIFSALPLLLCAIAVSAQVNPSISAVNTARPTTSKSGSNSDPSTATRARVLNQTKAPAKSADNDHTLQAHARGSFKNRARLESLGNAPSDLPQAKPASAPSTALKLVSNVNNNPSATSAPLVSSPAVANNVQPLGVVSPATSQIYRIGVGDVLDIKLNNNDGPASTLFTVIGGGMLEYPLAGVSLPVAGLTTNEIAALLKQRIKLFENPEVAVTVRDYASHSVTISGLVAAPGTKSLRREAVPLYTLLAEAAVLSDATRATITRGANAQTVDLNNPADTATLILPGDVIKIGGSNSFVAEYFFVAGEVKAPGQKPYHSGLTLTQAILAAGGTNESNAMKIKVSRQRSDGRVVTEEYDFKKIQDGKAIDPILQKDDRIDVSSN